MFEIITEDIYEDFSSNKEMFDFSNYSTKSKYYDDSNKSVIEKMKDETGGAATEEFVDNSEHKKAKSMNKNVVATICHNEYKHVLLKNKSLRHSVNRIRSKNHRIGTYEINKISLPCFDYKVYIQKNGYDG